MKKIVGMISWIMAFIGVGAINLTLVCDDYILFGIGVVMLVLGIIGVLITREKTKEVIWKLLDFLS